MERMDVTVESFYHSGADVFGDTESCAVISMTNKSDKDLGVSMWDWTVTDPNGVTHDTNFSADSNFEAVDLKPGANYGGTVCFQTDNAPGDHVLTFSEGFLGGYGYWKASM